MYEISFVHFLFQIYVFCWWEQPRYKQKYIHDHDSWKKLKQRNRVRAIWSVHIKYLHLTKIVAESHPNRDKRYVIEDLGVIWKEKKRVNRVDRLCIVLFHGGFEGLELYADKQWVKFIIEVPYTTWFPINNPSIKNNKKI